MLYDHLSYQKENHLVSINLPKFPKDHVSIPELANGLSDLCAALSLDKEVRVVIINWEHEEDPSPGKDWGEDFLWREEWEIKQRALADPIAGLDMPVIITIDGYAIGQALELALACDIRMATDTSHFGLPHIRTGMIPWDGGTQRLTRLVGKAKGLELILTGRVIDAQEAFATGLINKLTKPDELVGTGMEMAREMANKAPMSLRFAKEAVLKGMDLTLEQGLRLEADLYFLLHTTRDRTEGIQAFQEKRKGQFKGK